MPSPTSGSADATRPRGPSTPKPQARSAGRAERPTRNENLSDLVHFFQTQNIPVSGVDATTALPAVQSPTKEPLTKEHLKPLHRRLLQFTQRQKKDPSTASKSKADEQRRQIEALQREGYLPSGPKPVSSSRSTRSKGSMDSTLPKSEKNIENIGIIGQSRLEKGNRGDSPKVSADAKRRLASLDLGDFGSMLDVAVSLSTRFDDSSPPPYQASATWDASRRRHNSASQSTSALPLAKARSSQSIHSPTSPLADSKDAHSHRPTSSTSSSVRIVERGATPTSQPATQPAILHTTESSDSSGKGETKQTRSAEQRAQSPDHAASNPLGTHSKSLKLFPDVANPRSSSKNARRLSGVRRYQTPSSSPPAAPSGVKMEASDTFKPTNDKEQPSDKPSSDEPKDEAKPTCSGALAAPSGSTESATAEVTSQNALQGQVQATSRTPSLAMGTLRAFPLPAPTRPLPSIPQGHAPSASPEAESQPTIRMVRPGPKDLALQPSQPSPIAEDPRKLQGRPATALGYASEQDAGDEYDRLQSRTSLERSKSTEPEQHTPRRMASSILVPRMHDLHESPTERSSAQTFSGQPIVDSPVLPPTKPDGKRAARKGLQINPCVDRKHLPFGLPSPPPTAALPSNPPTQPPTERSASHRNYTAPTGAAMVRGLDIAFQGGPRASIVSRSNSSRSSLRHESIPESYEPSRCESPLPSSDDEGFGPSAATVRSRRIVEKQSHRAIPVGRGYETVDARPSHGRPRYPHSMRPLTPQDHSGHGMEKASSPQSPYSQSTYRSRDSQSSYHTQPGGSHAANFLEDRVANLERQNQILQAALLAALSAGVKNPLETLQGSAMSPTFPPSGLGNPYQNRYVSRPESWVSSSRNSEHSGCETPSSYRESRAKVRQLDNMIEDIESGWLSDKSSLSGARMTRNC